MSTSPPSETGLRLLVTGATGGLARQVIAEACAWDQTTILALVRSRSALTNVCPGVICQEVDLSDQRQVRAVLKGFCPTCVLHCAATGLRAPQPPWFEMERLNVEASLQLCESVSRIPGCQFIYISSGLAYREQGRPLREEIPLGSRHPYGAIKAAADILICSAGAALGMPVIVFRPFSFSGPGDTGTRLFPSLLRAAAEGRPFPMTSGEQVRDYCPVGDIARGVSLAIRCPAGHGTGVRVLNLGSGSSLPLRPLVERVVNELKLTVQLGFGDKEPVEFEPRHLVADISRAHAELGWRPRLNLAYAVWQLGQESFPALRLRQPNQWL